MRKWTVFYNPLHLLFIYLFILYSSLFILIPPLRQDFKISIYWPIRISDATPRLSISGSSSSLQNRTGTANHIMTFFMLSDIFCGVLVGRGKITAWYLFLLLVRLND